MFWDGERWLPDDGRPQAQPRKPSDHRLRNRLSVVVMAFALVGLLLPVVGVAGVADVAASTPSARTLLATWSANSKVAVYQETSSKVTYRGAWATTRNANYLGGKAKAVNTGRAKATLKFRGAAVSWVGPVGPTRGKAKVYIDGKLVKIVNTWASTFRPTRVLFQKSWNAVGTHSISIVTLGTAGHPTVAIDAFLVRLDTGVTSAPVDGVGSPTPAPTQAPTPAPTPVPTPAPTPTPTPTPAPQYTFDDEFSGPAGANPNYGLPTTYWYLDGCWHTGCGNDSPTQYSMNNAYLDGNGHLVLEADQGSSASCGFAPCQYTAAGLTMIDWNNQGAASWSQTYGTFSARIKMPEGQGLWPAFWMAGANVASVGWPMNGEIDVMESFGHSSNDINQGVIGGVPMLRSGTGWTLPAAGSIAGWHTYSMTWSPSGIQWRVDGTLTLSLTAAEAGNAWASSFNHPFNILLDLTVGGGPAGPPNASTVFPAKMLVDWIRVSVS